MSDLLQSRKVLIVDDFREMRVSLRGMLKKLWAERVDEAAEAEQALELMGTTAYDVVLCDYNLGDGRDGMQLFEEARHLGLLPVQSVFIMITAETSMDNVMAVVEYMPDGYLVKPVNPEVLALRIERAVQRRQVLKDIDDALRQSRFSDAVAGCDRQLQQAPKHRLDLLRLKAEALLGSGDTAAAAAIFEDVAASRPIPWAALGGAMVKFREGRLDEARSHCLEVIERFPTTMGAYDLLAGIEEARGDGEACQAVLSNAVSMSPRSIRRQQRLADKALANGHAETARQAFRKALSLGRHSCLARGGDITGFTRSTSDLEGPEAAMRALEDHCRNLREPGVENDLPVLLARGSLLHELGRADEARAAVQAAVEQLDSAPLATEAGLQLELARACFDTGLEDAATAVIERVVKSNHDRGEVTEAARALFHAVGRADQGKALIDSARKAIITVNNDGVRLAKEGRLQEAVELLAHAVEELPGNATVRLNLVQALLHLMRSQGSARNLVAMTAEHLERARGLAGDPRRIGRLSQSFAELLRRQAERVA